MKVKIIKEDKKKNCFSHDDYKTMEGKIECVMKQKGMSREDASAYVAGGLRKSGELKQENDLYIGGSVERIPSKEEKRKKVVEDLGFLQIKQIGQGNYGTVFRATEGKGKYRDAAVKVIDKGGGHAKKEIKNYVTIDGARQKNKYVARHFPEVYDVFETDKHAVIVMELLDPTSAGMSVVGDFLQGPEGHYRVGKPDQSMKDIDYRFRAAYGEKGKLAKTDMTGRVKNMFMNAKVLDHVIDDFLLNYGTMSDAAKEKITKNILGSSVGVLNAKPEVAKAKSEEIFDDLVQFGAVNPRSLRVILEDLQADPTLSWLLLLLIREAYTNTIDKDNFAESTEYAINDLVSYIRYTSAVNVVYDNAYSDEQIEDAEPGAASLMMAINALINEFSITPHDVHDKNALVRPGTGDIVIVDVGNFKEGGFQPPPLNETRRMIKVLIDKKR